MELQDAFLALGIGCLCTPLKDVKTTYHSLMKAHHPDRQLFWRAGLTAAGAHAASCKFTTAWDDIQAYFAKGGYKHGRNGDQDDSQAAGNNGGQRGRAAGAQAAAQAVYKLRHNRLYGTIAALLPGEISHTELLQFYQQKAVALGNNWELAEYGFGEEDHTEPAHPDYCTHFHFLLKWDHPTLSPNWAAPGMNPIGKSGHSLQVHWKRVENEQHFDNIRYYICKGGRALINFKEPLRKFSPQPAAAPAADGTKTFGTLIRDSIAKAVPVHEIMGLLEQEFPDVFYMSGQKLKESIESRVGRHAPVAHPLSSFVPPWDQPFEFTIDGSGAPSLWPRSIVLTGPAACGKTSLAKAQGDRPLVVHNGCLEALRHIVFDGPNKTTHIVFDEFPRHCAKKGISAEVAIALLDMEIETAMPARYNDIQIPPIPRIFCTNCSLSCDADHIFPRGINADQQEGINRRYRIIRITQNVFPAQAPPAAPAAPPPAPPPPGAAAAPSAA